MSKSFKRMSLIERSALTFQSYLNGDFGKRFYSDDFLAGICRTRHEMHIAIGKAASFLMLSSLALAYFDLLPPKVTILSTEIALSKSMIPILNVFASAGLLNLVLKFIDGVIIDRYISTIGNNISLYSFNLFLLDRNPVNIWFDPLTPRYFGETSGIGHKSILPIIGLLMIFLYFGIFILIVALITKTSYGVIISESELSAKLISSAAIIFVTLSAVLAFAFSIKFKFYDARYDEYSMEPTEALKKELQEQMGAQPIGVQQDKTA
jgi:hypothetical protein